MKPSALPLLVVAISALAVAPAPGQVSSRSVLPHAGPGDASGKQNGPDHDFAMAVAVFNKFSVIAGQVAMIETRDGRLREFAEHMVKDHTAALARLRSIAGRSSIALPAVIGPDDAYRAKIAAVRKRTGAAFDRAYCTQQMDALQDAEALLQSYAKTGGNAKFRRLGEKDDRPGAAAPTAVERDCERRRQILTPREDAMGLGTWKENIYKDSMLPPCGGHTRRASDPD